MIFEEITTKLDLSEEHKLSESKVVHVNFGADRDIDDTIEMPRPAVSTTKSTVISAPVRRKPSVWDTMDLRLPLILRLIAAIAVVGLSMLFLQ